MAFSVKNIHVITTFSVGGAEQFIRLLLKHQHFFSIIIYLKGIEKFKIKRYSNNILIGPLFKKNPLLSWFYLKYIIKKYNNVPVVTWLYHSDIIVGLMRIFYSKFKWYINVRSADNKKNIKNIITKSIVSVLSHQSSGIIYNSFASRELHNKYFYSKKNNIIIYNGYELNSYKSRDKIKKSLAFVGRSHIDKGVDRLLDFINSHGEDLFNMGFSFHIAGISEKYILRNLNKKNRTYINKYIFFYPYVYTPIFLSDKSIFLLLSRTESFPNVILEALLSSCFVISTDVGDVKRLLHEHLYVIENFNNGTLHSAIINNAYSVIKLETLNYIRSNFDIDKVRIVYEKYLSTNQSY